MKTLTTIVNVYAPNGLSYYVQTKNPAQATLLRLSHILRNTGYKTKIVKG